MATEHEADDNELSVVEQRKQEFRNRYKGGEQDLIKLAKIMRGVQDTQERLKEELAIRNAEFDVLRMEIIPEAMEQKGLENFTVEGLCGDRAGRVSLTADLLVSTKKGMKDKFFAWLKKNKLGDLIQPNVNSSTLKGFVKKRKLAGKKVPDDLLNITPVTRASITKV